MSALPLVNIRTRLFDTSISGLGHPRAAYVWYLYLWSFYLQSAYKMKCEALKHAEF